MELEKALAKIDNITHQCIERRCHYYELIGNTKSACPNWVVEMVDDKYFGFCMIERSKYYTKRGVYDGFKR